MFCLERNNSRFYVRNSMG